MREVVLITISLNKMAGGLERNIVWLANMLNKNNYKVTLITFDAPSAVSFYAIDKNIEWVKIGFSEAHKKTTILKKFQIFLAIRKNLRSKLNACVVVFHHGILSRVIFSSLGLKLRVICSERNALSLYNWVKKSKLNLNFILLLFVDKITVQFEKYINDYPFFIRKKISVIGNSVSPPFLDLDNECKDASFFKKKVILNIGRLSSQKNQDILIKEFKNLSLKYTDWNLYIVGNGELDLYLRNLIEELNLVERVFIVEPNNNIEYWYINADIFCMPSRWEGFPNALAEALSYGIPSLGLRSCDGVNQLIQSKHNGFLCDISEISHYLELLIVNEDMRKRLGINAKRIIEKYNPNEIEKKWLSILENSNG